MESGFMHQLLQQLINGLSLGSIYALIALGYTMIYGILKLINFAHGDIYMVGAYIGYIATTVFHLPFFPSLLIAMAGAALVGMLIERVAYRPMRNAPRIAILITAIGVSFFLENGMILLASPQPRTFSSDFAASVYNVGGLVINSQQIIILGSTIVLMLALTYIVNYTKIGKAMRAVSFDADAARLMGINIDRVISMTFALGSALAAAGGVLVGIYYNSIDPLMGMAPGIKAFVAAVLGGIGIIPGAMVGGIILGIVEALVSGFISSTFRDAAAFLKADLKKLGFCAALFAVLYVLLEMEIIGAFWELNLVLIIINIILATSLNMINGYTGQFSIGHAGFFAVGAYMGAIMTVKLGYDMPVALIAGTLSAGLLGFLVGLPTLRLNGDYLAIATLGLGEIIRICILNIEYVGGASGLMGIPRLTTFPLAFWIMIAILFFIKNFKNSAYGRACLAIRENEIAADTMGIDTTRYKVMAFTLGASFAGTAGVLFSHYFFIAHPASFTFMRSFDILTMVVLGGLGSMTGSITGAIVLTFISAALSDFPEWRMLIYSIAMIVLMLYRPQGLFGDKELSLAMIKRFKKGGNKS